MEDKPAWLSLDPPVSAFRDDYELRAWCIERALELRATGEGRSARPNEILGTAERFERYVKDGKVKEFVKPPGWDRMKKEEVEA